jgi:hypothetical protein
MNMHQGVLYAEAMHICNHGNVNLFYKFMSWTVKKRLKGQTIFITVPWPWIVLVSVLLVLQDGLPMQLLTLPAYHEKPIMKSKYQNRCHKRVSTHSHWMEDSYSIVCHSHINLCHSHMKTIFLGHSCPSPKSSMCRPCRWSLGRKALGGYKPCGEQEQECCGGGGYEEDQDIFRC